MIRVMLFDRFDQPIGELAEGDVFALERSERVNGEHSLKITTTRVLEQGQRVLTRDARGKWREHVVYGTDALHAAGERPFGDYYCVWSLQADLMGTRVSRMPGVQTPVAASVALGYAIEGTARWQAGTVTNTATGGGSMYDMDGWSALGVLVANWGGEIDATIEVGTSGVTARKVDLYAKQGEQTAKRRYDFGADVSSVRRKIADGPLYCRITPRGMGEESGAGYGRKITIESVNGGKDYLENADMVDLAKLPDGSGGWEYPTVEVENSDCTTPAALLAWAQTVLAESTVPQITYEIDVMQLAREGVDMHGVSLGDTVQIVDRKFGSGLRVSARVLRIDANLLDDDDIALTVGSISKGMADMIGGLDARLTTVTNTVQAMNGGTMSTAEYLSRLLDRLNTQINGLGGYTYITEGQGIRCYDAAVSDPLVGAEASAVVEIKGGTIRIADSKTAQGAWEWKTVFVSGHIAAALVTVCNITAGWIGNATGTYWNLDTGKLHIAGTADLGDRTVSQAIDNLDAAATSVAVVWARSQSSVSAPSSGWSTTPPAWEDGYFIWQCTATTKGTGASAQTTYSNPVCLSGRGGQGGTVSSVSYGVSSSATVEPSTWQSSEPAVQTGQWLWKRTVYSDGSTFTAKECSGADGSGTQMSVGIASIVEQYYLSASYASPMGGSWSAAQPTWSTGHYIWTRSVITWDDYAVTTTAPALATSINSTAQAAEDAAKTATNYLDFDPSTGLDVGYSGSSSKTRINGDGVEMFDGNGDSAMFVGLQSGVSVSRVGKTTGGKVVATSAGSVDIESGLHSLAHFGYETANGSGSTPANFPYYTLGTRAADTGELVGGYSFTAGEDNIARYGDSAAIGALCKALGYYAFASGYNCEASAFAAHAEGDSTKAEGYNSHAEGESTEAIGRAAHAEGHGTKASGYYAHAEGAGSEAQGLYSHAEGYRTYATETCSHAEGYRSRAQGYYSHAGGEWNYANKRAQTAIGAHCAADNSSTTNHRSGLAAYGRYALIVGNGEWVDDSHINNSNALTLQWDGTMAIAGTLTQNSDRRLKEHVAFLADDAVAFARSLKPVLYNKDGARHVGFYAQDVQASDPWGTSMVSEGTEDESLGFVPLALDYTALVAPLTAYAQHLEARIAQLESRLAAQEGGVE